MLIILLSLVAQAPAASVKDLGSAGATFVQLLPA